MNITQDDEKGSLLEILDSLSSLEDNEPRKGSKVHKLWQDKVINKQLEYNTKVQWEAFKKGI